MNLKQKLYIFLFALLYAVVAFSSTLHAISFFGLANEEWLAVILAVAFEIGQAAVLFSILNSSKERKKIMPWVLMAIFTIVQILGNIYSSYKHIMENSIADLKWFKEPVFIWTSIPDEQATVIVTYIVGAILPICALLLTAMVTNYLEDSKKIDELEKKVEEKEEEIEQVKNLPENVKIEKEVLSEKKVSEPHSIPIEETPTELPTEPTTEPTTEAPTEIPTEDIREEILEKDEQEEFGEENEEINSILNGEVIPKSSYQPDQSKQSRFLNLK